MILNPPKVALVQSSITNVSFAIQSEKVSVGTVDTVNYLCNKVSVGQTCLFNKTDAMILEIASQYYYIIDDDNVTGVQEAPPP